MNEDGTISRTKRAYIDFYQAMKMANLSFIGPYLSQEEGALSIGAGLKEWWEGYGIISEVYKAPLKEMQSYLLATVAGQKANMPICRDGYAPSVPVGIRDVLPMN